MSMEYLSNVKLLIKIYLNQIFLIFQTTEIYCIPLLCEMDLGISWKENTSSATIVCGWSYNYKTSFPEC